MSFVNLEDDDKLRILLNSASLEQLKELIRDYNDECIKNNQKENKIKGYSKYRKLELTDFIISSLSDEYKKKLLPKIEKQYVQYLISDGILILKNQDTREVLNKVEHFEGLETGYSFIFKGFNWETETKIILADDGSIDDFICGCRIAQNQGLCRHFFTGLIYLLNIGELDPNNLGIFFEIEDDKLKEIKSLEVVIGKSRPGTGVETLMPFDKIETAPVIEQFASEDEKQRVSIYDAKIVLISENKSTFQDHVNIWYLIKIQGGECGNIDETLPDKEPFNEINIRCSKKLMEKEKLKVNDIISFKGTLKRDNFFGLLLQNIRKIVKSN